jgi:hypothetical protein
MTSTELLVETIVACSGWLSSSYFRAKSRRPTEVRILKEDKGILQLRFGPGILLLKFEPAIKVALSNPAVGRVNPLCNFWLIWNELLGQGS